MKDVIISSNWFDARVIVTDNPRETLVKYYIHYYKNVMNSWIDNDMAQIVTNDGCIIKMEILDHLDYY